MMIHLYIIVVMIMTIRLALDDLEKSWCSKTWGLGLLRLFLALGNPIVVGLFITEILAGEQ